MGGYGPARAHKGRAYLGFHAPPRLTIRRRRACPGEPSPGVARAYNGNGFMFPLHAQSSAWATKPLRTGLLRM